MSDKNPNQAEKTTANIASDRAEHLRKAVYQHKAGSLAGFSERLFTWMFKGLVYPQIWEDPDVDMKALKLCLISHKTQKRFWQSI